MKALADWRDYHALGHAGGERTLIERIADGIRVHAPDGSGASFVVLSTAAIARDTHEWYNGVEYAQERARGLDDVGNVLHAGNFTAVLNPVRDPLVRAIDEEGPDARHRRRARAPARTRRRTAALVRRGAVHLHAGPHGPGLIPHARPRGGSIRRATREGRRDVVPLIDHRPTIRGSPHWGRDTMTSLPGLLLRTGRADVAAALYYARSRPPSTGGCSQTRFPTTAARRSYNTVDGSLLFIDALHRYVNATNDRTLLADLFGTVDAIVAAYRDGTRYGISMATRTVCAMQAPTGSS